MDYFYRLIFDLLWISSYVMIWKRGVKGENESSLGGYNLVMLKNKNILVVLELWILVVGAEAQRCDQVVSSCRIILRFGFSFFIYYVLKYLDMWISIIKLVEKYHTFHLFQKYLFSTL